MLLEGGEPAHIPEPLRGYAFYRLERPWRLDQPGGYESLYRHLTGYPRVMKPMLGALTKLPPRSRRSEFQSTQPTLGLAEPISQLLPVIVGEVTKVIKDLVTCTPETSQKAGAGCPGLYHLYMAMDKFVYRNEEFVAALHKAPSRQDAKALVPAYEELVNSFAHLVRALRDHSARLQIFDPQVAEKLIQVVGFKLERLRFWLEILRQNRRRLKAKNQLYRLEKLRLPGKSYFFLTDPGELSKHLKKAGTLSLYDEAAVTQLVREAELRISEIKSVNSQLAEFIKAHCSYADLFTSR